MRRDFEGPHSSARGQAALSATISQPVHDGSARRINIRASDDDERSLRMMYEKHAVKRP